LTRFYTLPFPLPKAKILHFSFLSLPREEIEKTGRTAWRKSNGFSGQRNSTFPFFFLTIGDDPSPFPFFSSGGGKTPSFPSVSTGGFLSSFLFFLDAADRKSSFFLLLIKLAAFFLFLPFLFVRQSTIGSFPFFFFPLFLPKDAPINSEELLSSSFAVLPADRFPPPFLSRGLSEIVHSLPFSSSFVTIRRSGTSPFFFLHGGGGGGVFPFFFPPIPKWTIVINGGEPFLSPLFLSPLPPSGQRYSRAP